MTQDEKFLTEFEACRWPLEHWHHREHIKVAYLNLRRYSFDAAMNRIRESIKAHNAAHHVPDTPTRGYHETMTQAWMRLVHATLCEYGPADTADGFFDQHPQLAEKKVLRLFYSRDLFMSPRAKVEFVEPDLAPLPRSGGNEPPLECSAQASKNEDKAAVEYREIGADQLDFVRPLWEKLAAWHVSLSPQFAARRAARTFEGRKEELLAKGKSGKLKVDVACAAGREAPVGYCISSVASDGSGELDSLFVEEQFRRRGVGKTLTKRALGWLDDQGAAWSVVVVAHGNDATFEFYRRFGFVADNVSLRRTALADQFRNKP